jgi:acetyl-CoA acetyltransferase
VDFGALCLFDNCLETDGALAVVVVSAERARDCRHAPAYIHSFAQGFHAQIYDAFTPLIPLSLEGYGFCGRGEGASYTDSGNISWPEGALPVNTSGGGLSEAYVHGYNLIVEGVRQIRGTSTCQVDDARTCLVTSGEGVPTSALLRRS